MYVCTHVCMQAIAASISSLIAAVLFVLSVFGQLQVLKLSKVSKLSKLSKLSLKLCQSENIGATDCVNELAPRPRGAL